MYDDGLTKAGWSSLADRRNRIKLCQFFKFYHKIHDITDFDVVFTHVSKNCASARTCRKHHLIVPRHNYEAYKQSFRHSCIAMWNHLPEDYGFVYFSALSQLCIFYDFMTLG